MHLEARSPTDRGARSVFLAAVRANDPVCRDHYRLILALAGFPSAQPGQFVQILCADPEGPPWAGGAFTRRPFSIGGLRRTGNDCELDIIYRVIGPGTKWLAGLRPGVQVSVLGPLGRPFELPADRPVAYLVGGGVGLPPMIWLAEVAAAVGRQVVAFCGARSADSLPLRPRGRQDAVPLSPTEPTLCMEEFAQWGVPAVVCTDDGTLGRRGRVPEVFTSYLASHADEAAQAVVYTCGPEPMLRLVARSCELLGIPCQVCLERTMACGMGTCQSCVVRIRDASDAQGWRYQLCCTDGPVFDSRAVVWQDEKWGT